ncbi:MAG TPA: hypothetical protein PKA41_09990 [Verrucomicrobiota bacterium]|nr:hypothetical protein [Verrucomicrobiota bacterium]
MAQTTLTNGGNHSGTLANTTNYYEFAGNTGDNILLRAGGMSLSPILQLFGPDDVLIRTATASSVAPAPDTFLTFQLTNSGTFRVAVRGGTGNYTLRFARTPDSFEVPAGDEGGPLTNGAAHSGVMLLGDLDLWSFEASEGDAIELRMGSSGTGPPSLVFAPEIRLYAPDGSLIGISITLTSSLRDGRLSASASSGGTYLVVVNSCYPGYTGNYKLHFARVPGTYVVSAGDQGGVLTNGSSQNATIDMGDMDVWNFNACEGQSVLVQCERLTGAAGFFPRVRIYGRDGKLLASAENTSTSMIQLPLQPTNSGAFTAIISADFQGTTGTYQITATGISGDGVSLCPPRLTDSTLSLSGVGGEPDAIFLIQTTTDLAADESSWQTIRTNQFDAFGTFSCPAQISPHDPERYFRVFRQ